MERSRNILSSSLICMLVILLFMVACTMDEDEPTFIDEEMEAYEHVINLQDEVDSQLDEWFSNMDSLDAIRMAQQEFANDPGVSEAIISSQGISVQYTNGIRGGIFINPLDDISELDQKIQLDLDSKSKNLSKTAIVNQKEMILLNPHYWERSYYTDQVYSINRSSLEKVNIDNSTFFKNEESTVDRFTQLSDYGIIQIYSHGWAWPKETNITEVYVLTGETENETTSKKYWNDLTKGNIPVVKITGSNNYYFLSPTFIADHNNFSADTILFYGSFCYSFLGNWPDIIDEFADGAYVGYDWSVYTHKNANWVVNSIYSLSDTTTDKPVTLNEWFNDDNVPKSYWSEKNNKEVHIHYAGDGNLKLWDDVKIRLIPLSSNGTPVNNPGEVGVAYPFKCIVSTGSDIFLEFTWDIGDGSSPISASNEVNITWSESGQYTLKVDVIDGFDETVYGTASLEVTIGEEDPGIEDVVEFITSCTEVKASFKAGVQYSPENTLYEFNSHVFLDWSGLSFNGTLEESNSGETWNYSITGTISSDGQKVSYEANMKQKWVVGEQVLSESNYTISVIDYPLSLFEPEGSYGIDPFASYGSIYSGSIDVRQYVSRFEGYLIENGVTYTVTGVDWDNVTNLSLLFSKD